MKRRGTLGRKDKSNSIIQYFFSWVPLSGEEHAVSPDLVPWISQKSWDGGCFRKHSWASVSPSEGSWSPGAEAFHINAFCQCFYQERGLKPRLDLRELMADEYSSEMWFRVSATSNVIDGTIVSPLPPPSLDFGVRWLQIIASSLSVERGFS